MTKTQAIEKALVEVRHYLEMYIPENADVSEVYVNELSEYQNMYCCASVEIYRSENPGQDIM